MIPPLRRLLGETGPNPPWDDTAPIRAELFGVERLEEHARSLAVAQVVGVGVQRGAQLASRLAENEAVLVAAYKDAGDALRAGAPITPAAEWLIDNFYVIETQIRQIRADLPRGYYRQLPKLASGPFARYPRVFGVAWAYVAHTDSLFDPEVLRRYLRAYQEVQPLTIGEVWAVAITLRIVLVENLRRIAKRIIDSRAGRAAADALADRLLGIGAAPAEPAERVLPARGDQAYPDSFLVQMVHRLRDQDPSIAPALNWLDEQLAWQQTTAEAVVREEQQRQVTASVTVRNIITSMRFISDVDWTELFERLNLIDEALSEGPGFAAMDFPSRNLYRSAVEELARGSNLSELEVARAAVAAASKGSAPANGGPANGGPANGGRANGGNEPAERGRRERERLADPGYFLIAGGRTVFEARIGFRAPPSAWLGRLYRRVGIGGYVGLLSALGAVILWAALAVCGEAGAGPWRLLLLGLVGAAPAADLAVALANSVLTRGVRATPLPALDFSDGVPDASRTLVVVPTLLTSLEAVARQVERLEIHFLASQSGALHFALLSDWRDADAEHVDGDSELLDAAREGVARLNARHGAVPGGGQRFLLYHRRRLWNAGEGRWMGWERKRGKLNELNRVLRGGGDTTFIDPPPPPAGVRYVITLDADTLLPRDAAGRLIGKMAHPLNRPRHDPELGRVVEGYAIMQPRVTPALPTQGRGTLFMRTFSSPTGIDPYAAAVSDVYQDLFGEGSFTGKGIYDVDAFEAALAGRIPESAILSHDLLEGIFARAALVSDVEVVEAFPARYDTAALRSHRWARGDWQLLPWILGRAGGGGGRLPAIGRWKMLDNLRRSLTPPSMVLALIAGWVSAPPQALIWTLFILATIAGPPLLPLLSRMAAPPPGVSLSQHWRALGHDARLVALQVLLTVVFLAHQAWLMGDAIVRTLIRLLVTRRRLLEWVPADQASFGPRATPAGFYRAMGGAVVIALAALACAWGVGHGAWPLAALFAAAWLVSPLAALRASAEGDAAPALSLDSADRLALRLIARQTWRFFETFVTAAENHLPPDNFQETPAPVVAHRTSPTNIGLYLLSATSARDLGWIGTLEAVERLEATLATMERMTRFRGHFLNWYDTRDLRPLDPQYVSSVDSGNLAGHLIAVANACREWRRSPPGAGPGPAGVGDALELARRAARRLAEATPTPPPDALAALEDALARMAGALGDAASETAPPWRDLAEQASRLERAAQAAAPAWAAEDEALQDLTFWTRAVSGGIGSLARDLEAGGRSALDARLEAVALAARQMAMAMAFDFLLDPNRLLLSIGYQVRENLRDTNCYDLLASEARLASFVAIAKGDVPARHWFRLGHTVTALGDSAALISWSGSMFEYLMPSLVIRSPQDSLIEQTNRLIVQRQIDYGQVLKTPWGVSESAYNARDTEFTYQYSNFGVPGLGLKRGLADNAVIAPYATALAAMVDPKAAARNFERLEGVGARGRYGFYEAVDFTPARLADGASHAVVRTYMAHHQGMTITAIADILLGGLARDRFHAEPMVQATELLLQERMPREAPPATPPVSDTPATAVVREAAQARAWRSASPWGDTPATQLLSNGRYTVMITAAGSGYSAWRDLAVTRWREDATCDDWGSFILLRDVASGTVWSATYQPIGEEPGAYTVIFNEHSAKFERRDGTLSTTLEVVVSAEDDAEARRLTILNEGEHIREIEVTSFAEVTVGPRAADDAHPVFSKMFVETEHLAGPGAILATRRPRTADEARIWAAHLAVVDGPTVGMREFETDRLRFFGRGGNVHAPIAAVTGRPLTGTTGAVLDPVFVLRRRVRIAPGGTARMDFWTMVASSRDEILDLADKHQDMGAFERALGLARTQVQVQLQHLGIDHDAAGVFQRLAGHAIYATPALRASSDAIAEGRGGQPGLWGMGISGDLPIVLVRISDMSELALARDALQAVEYWRMKRLAVDLVILNERAISYVQDLQIALETLVRASQSRPQISDERPPGHIFILRADLIAPEARSLLCSVARIVLGGEFGSILDQLDLARRFKPSRRALVTRRGAASQLRVTRPEAGLEFFNGQGGFDQDGREYVVILGPGEFTPAPWTNIVANPEFGFQVSAEGAGFTWSLNSRDHQLTPWSNDPVTDRSGQALYIRDEETGDLWSPTASPIRDGEGTYVARHGWGYSRFEHAAHGVAAELVEFVPLADPIKISRLTLRNTTGAPRRLSVTAYVEWVLGSLRGASAPFVTTWRDPASLALFAGNDWTPAYAGRVAFIDLAGRQTAWTADRREFIGRNGGLGRPAALAPGATLSGRAGSGLDPCGALQATVLLAPNEAVEVDVLLGDAAGEAAARALIDRYRAADLGAVLGEVKAFWEETTGALRVSTPDRSMDLMLNGWLIYQSLACRIWGRSGFYQASGAYGFRDQLQDGMALASVRPDLTREHLLRAAGRQFPEGDVQHWWLPGSGQGVRTRISDDRAWLAYAVAHYVRVTGDTAVLDETTPFLTGPALKPGQSDNFFQPGVADKAASLYDHCALALDASLAVGAHGAPLMGAGDWNDGFNRVGQDGRGESVWLGWFLHAAMDSFIPWARARGDLARVEAWRAHMAALSASLQAQAWDGAWYKRGWFDDGAPLGSAANEECRIDSIAQSWAVISGAAPRDRAQAAMDAVERELILPQEGLALLFTPPFEHSARDPGYIESYPAGLRENGGQYTHGALWSVIAFAMLGEGDKAAALFALLNPINHARTPTDVHRYKVEPYVTAADIYSASGHVGRGGWTWYTGSAAWMQRAGVESILGVNIEAGRLTLDPCIPSSWPRFDLTLRRGAARYHVAVENPRGVQRGVAGATLDGTALAVQPLSIPLVDDGAEHALKVVMG